MLYSAAQQSTLNLGKMRSWSDRERIFRSCPRGI
jgi:hypothetical protein